MNNNMKKRNDESPDVALQQCKVGGPFLDEGIDEASSSSRRPIITPPLRSHHNSTSAQYLLIPEKDRIQVLSMDHGGTIMELTSQGKSERPLASLSPKGSIQILSLEVVRGSQDNEWLLVAGCSNSTLLEWSLNDVHDSSTYQGGTNFSSIRSPRRIIRLTTPKKQNGDITHVSSSSEPLKLYALIRHASSKNAAQFVSISLPPWLESTEGVVDSDRPYTIEIDPHLHSYFVKKTKQKHQNAITESTVTSEVNNLKTTSEFSDNIISVPSLPILLLSGMINLQPFALIVQPKGFTVFCENSTWDTRVDRFVHFPRLEKIDAKITTAAISPDCEHVALGMTDGKVHVYNSVLSRTARFVEFQSHVLQNVQIMDTTMEHPASETLVQQFHWHALPVIALCYLGSGPTSTLLSGGEESVLVTWNTEQGITKPSHTLPRISKGAISHVVTNKLSSSMDIVLRCMDNTLQVIQAHNYLVKWRIQGLATAVNEPVGILGQNDSNLSSNPIIVLDPKTKIPILSRLAGAPGLVQWFDFMTGRVVGQLEVAPYNRVSRKEANQLAYPRPVVTHLVLSATGDDMVTVDTMLTENPNVGARRTVAHGSSRSDMSLTTNIKFWAWSKSLEGSSGRGISMPYDMIAAMHAPHGLYNHIDAIALTPVGHRACTFSFHDGSFHIWDKDRKMLGEDGKQSSKSTTTPPTPPWRRLYKISTPAGFANAGPSQDMRGSNVAFSADGSLLAVAYGKNITLWDHSSATMLHTVVAYDTLSDIQFIKSPTDMLLAVGGSFISSLPLFGPLYLGGGIWSYSINQLDKSVGEPFTIELGPVTPLLSSREIAIVLREKRVLKISSSLSSNISSSKIVVIECQTGDAKTIKKSVRVFWDVPGSVVSLCDISSRNHGNTSLLAIKHTGEMIHLSCSGSHDTNDDAQMPHQIREVPRQRGSSRAEETDSVPILPMLKKQRLDDSQVAPQRDAPDSSVLQLSSESSFSLPTSELPILSSSFTTNILGRSLKS